MNVILYECYFSKMSVLLCSRRSCTVMLALNPSVLSLWADIIPTSCRCHPSPPWQRTGRLSTARASSRLLPTLPILPQGSPTESPPTVSAPQSCCLPGEIGTLSAWEWCHLCLGDVVFLGLEENLTFKMLGLLWTLSALHFSYHELCFCRLGKFGASQK